MFPSAFDASDHSDRKAEAEEEIEELTGKLTSQNEEDKLMHSVLESDEDTIQDGKLLSESVSQGIGSFTPDVMYQNMVDDFKLAKKLYGETIIRELTSYDPSYIEKNISVPEFQRELEDKLKNKVQNMQEKKLLDKDGRLTDSALTLAALVLYTEELDHLVPRGMGEHKKKEFSVYGEKAELGKFTKSRYADLAIKASVKKALRRGHKTLTKDDLVVFNRETRGNIHVVYAIDASGSMRGEKLKTAKKAGIALAFKAISEKNKVGLLVFGSDIKSKVEPCLDFMGLLRELSDIRAGMETDIAKTISTSLELFPRHARHTKHLVLLTDALPTRGKDPKEETLQAVSLARSYGITVSLVGIQLNNEGRELAEKVVETGEGRLYVVNDLENVDTVVLEDYYALQR